MKREPLVSIIMNCHNGEKYLLYSLKSVLNQQYKNWELIFWDNKSTDGSAKIVKNLRDKRIRYFYSSKKDVLYKARNLAIKKSKGEFIAFLDVDDMWTKDKLKLQISKLLKHKKAGLIFGNFYKFYNSDKKKIAYKNNLPEGKITNFLVKNYQVAFLTVVIRKKFLKNFKVFDYNYDLLADYDFVLFFSINNKFVSINKPLAYYRIHDEQLQKKEMEKQATQFCKWFKNKNIQKKLRYYDLSRINQKYYYFYFIKNLKNLNLSLIKKTFKHLNLKNLVRIIILILFSKKLLYKFSDNV